MIAKTKKKQYVRGSFDEDSDSVILEYFEKDEVYLVEKTPIRVWKIIKKNVFFIAMLCWVVFMAFVTTSTLGAFSSGVSSCFCVGKIMSDFLEEFEY